MRNIAGIEYEVVEEYSESGLCYEWHDAAILRDVSSGALYYVSGSGCSCDHLWDHVNGLDDMTPIASLAEGVDLASREFPDTDTYEIAKRLMF